MSKPATLLVLSLAWAVQAPVSGDAFVTISDGHFIVAGRPHYFAGANFWQGMNLAVDGPSGDRSRLTEELDQLQRLGVTNLRVMAASEGPNTEPYRMIPSLMIAPGAYDEEVLDGLDYLLAQIAARRMRAVIKTWPARVQRQDNLRLSETEAETETDASPADSKRDTQAPASVLRASRPMLRFNPNRQRRQENLPDTFSACRVRRRCGFCLPP